MNIELRTISNLTAIGILFIAISLSTYYKNTQLASILLLVSISILCNIIFFIYDLKKRFSTITRSIKAISKGDLKTSIPNDILQSTDELGDLARSFHKTATSLKLAIDLGMSKEELGLSPQEVLTAKREAEQQRDAFLSGFIKSPIPTWFIEYIDGEPCIRDVNTAFCKLYGYTKEELIGKNPRIVKSGELSKKYYAKMYKSILNPTIGCWTDTIKNKRKDGKKITVFHTINTIFDTTGKPKYSIDTHIDIAHLPWKV